MMAEIQPPAIELRAISKAFGTLTAVDALSLTIPRGTVYGFIGPNGAGKTTTIRMIMDIIAPDRGEILFGGAPRSRASTERLGYLPEERGLYKKMKVAWALEYFARLKGMRDRKDIRARAERWLDKLGLLHRKDSLVEALSKGNQQKVQFITTVLHEPDVIILDEPFSGLDPVNQELLARLIAELKADGRTVIFSTHIMEHAERLCDRVFMILGGKSMVDGPLDEVRARFGKGLVSVELAARADEPEEVRRTRLANLPTVASVHARKDRGREVFEVVLREGRSLPDLLRELADIPEVRRVERKEASLHDVFCAVAGRDVFAEDRATPAAEEKE